MDNTTNGKGQEAMWLAELLQVEHVQRFHGPGAETITIPRRSFWHTMWAFYVAEYKAIVGR
jgi:hypothetical protein